MQLVCQRDVCFIHHEKMLVLVSWKKRPQIRVTFCLIHRGNDSCSRSCCKGGLWYEFSRYIIECSPTGQTRIYSRPRIFKEGGEEQWFLGEFSVTRYECTETSSLLLYLVFLFLSTTNTPAQFTHKCIYPYFWLQDQVGWYWLQSHIWTHFLWRGGVGPKSMKSKQFPLFHG